MNANLLEKEQKLKVLNEFINFDLIKIARKYLQLLKDNRKINTNEIILKVLDTAVYLSEKDIDINDENFEKIFRKVNHKEQNKIIKSLENPNNDKIYKELAIELGVIFWIIKDKKMQDKLFKFLYNLYIKNDEDINLLLNIKKDNSFYNEYKPEFISNIHNNKLYFNLCI